MKLLKTSLVFLFFFSVISLIYPVKNTTGEEEKKTVDRSLTTATPGNVPLYCDPKVKTFFSLLRCRVFI
jgi:hypothetical protein